MEIDNLDYSKNWWKMAKEINLIPAPNGFICPDDPGEPGLKIPRWSVNEIEARIVSEFCRGLRVLEIGTGLGISTKEIARRAKWVYTVDIDPWVKENIAPSLPDNVLFYDNIKKIGAVNFDAAFIDGLHNYSQCTQDIEDARRLVKRDGLFIFHDAKMDPIRGAVHNAGLQATYIATAAGLVIAWNGGQNGRHDQDADREGGGD